MDEPLDSLANLIYEYLYGEVLSDASFQSSPSSRLAEIAQGVAELSNLYTRQRRWLSPELLTNSSLRNAYLAYFLPCNLVKVRRIFQEILAHPKGALHFTGHRRLLDIGCGPGTNLLAFLSLLVEGTVLTDSLVCCIRFGESQSPGCAISLSPIHRQAEAIQKHCIPRHIPGRIDAPALSEFRWVV